MEGGGLRGMKDAVSVDEGGEIGEDSMVIWTKEDEKEMMETVRMGRVMKNEK